MQMTQKHVGKKLAGKSGVHLRMNVCYIRMRDGPEVDVIHVCPHTVIKRYLVIDLQLPLKSDPGMRPIPALGHRKVTDNNKHNS